MLPVGVHDILDLKILPLGTDWLFGCSVMTGMRKLRCSSTPITAPDGAQSSNFFVALSNASSMDFPKANEMTLVGQLEVPPVHRMTATQVASGPVSKYELLVRTHVAEGWAAFSSSDKRFFSATSRVSS